MLKYIYYHRHGQTSISAVNGSYGNNQYRVMLTERGIQESLMLGQGLAQHAPFGLYLTSPLPRAVQTATLVSRQIGQVEIKGEPSLSEPINEQPREVWKRVTKLAEELLKSPYQKALLSTHGYIFYCLTTYFKGMDLGELKHFVNPPTGAFAWVALENGKVVEANWECKEHLEMRERLPIL
ncbi:phosphoglycerate mutase family protein [Candidatus Chlorohelix sp.]|uniref:phosphoglycerate mutase family protein n=1 Tax=Candidatus Chlorohelix sp. TaxID=3139201 RepID=UPI003072828F